MLQQSYVTKLEDWLIDERCTVFENRKQTMMPSNGELIKELVDGTIYTRYVDVSRVLH